MKNTVSQFAHLIPLYAGIALRFYSCRLSKMRAVAEQQSALHQQRISLTASFVGIRARLEKQLAEQPRLLPRSPVPDSSYRATGRSGVQRSIC